MDSNTGSPDLYTNFLDVIRSGRNEDLLNPIAGGHFSGAIMHLANISCRLGGRSLRFDGATENFIDCPEADALLTRDYRAPYTVPVRAQKILSW